jgi:hypothetical protein
VPRAVEAEDVDSVEELVTIAAQTRTGQERPSARPPTSVRPGQSPPPLRHVHMATVASPRERRDSGGRRQTRGGDSGDDGPSDEPPQAGRPPCSCGCGLSMAGKRPQAKYLNDAHRKRAQRERDRLDSDRPAERRLLQLVQERPPAPVRCKCDPRPQLVDENVCVPCGRPRGSASAAWLNEAANLRSKQLSSRAPAHRNLRYGDPKRKPVREYIDREAVAALPTTSSLSAHSGPLNGWRRSRAGRSRTTGSSS